MKLIKFKETIKYDKNNQCTVYEYPLNDTDINCAIGEIRGRYPEEGYCLNEKCKELIFIIEGSGTINKSDETIYFEKNDIVFIDKGEMYYWDANCTVIMPCTPAWYPEQYKIIKTIK